MSAPAIQQRKITRSLICALPVVAVLQTQLLPNEARAEGVAVSPCLADPFRVLDFKLGAYAVTTAAGQAAGMARVEKVLDGCLIIEHWQGAEGGDGRAQFYFDADRELWHLHYVNVDGQTLTLVGLAVDGKVRFTGKGNFYGMKGLHRMSWVSLPDGNVEQVWDLSEDEGATWRPVFRGLYHRTD